MKGKHAVGADSGKQFPIGGQNQKAFSEQIQMFVRVLYSVLYHQKYIARGQNIIPEKETENY